MRGRFLLTLSLVVCASAARADDPPKPGAPAKGATAPAPTPAAPAAPVAPPATAPATTAAAATDPTRSAEMQAYHAAFAKRRLGSDAELRVEDVEARLREAEELLTTGRTDQAIARLTEIVEHPRFSIFESTELGRGARYLLGDALANAGIYESARGYLRKVVEQPAAWQDAAIYGRRASRRLVEIAIQESATGGLASLTQGQDDLKAVPANAPEDVKGELAYLQARTKEMQKDWDGAIASYMQVTTKSRHWAQATYLAGLIHVEQGRFKEGEDLFCKVADPKRQNKTTPVLADERFFAVRDLARLALGRVAHEKSRFDDSRYYYYLVPKDSDRLAEAIYEAATSRYEKKDYDGARELIDELYGMNTHHRYEDEVQILDAYIDLAQCKFFDADKKLRRFIARYEPVRDAARRMQASDRGMRALLAAARGGSDAAASDASAVSVSTDGLRAVAALVRVDPAWTVVSRRLAVLDHEASGLRLARSQLKDLEGNITVGGGLKPSLGDSLDAPDRGEEARAALDGLRRSIEEIEGEKGKDAKTFRAELTALEARFAQAGVSGRTQGAGARSSGTDLPDLVKNDGAKADALLGELEVARKELGTAESALAKDALTRLDLRLSRLLRRARLGRIESVLGKKRSLEVEIEAIQAGYLPQDAVDSIDPVRYLKDNEEYWPFEGDDWADEFVGGEKVK